jgi:hypothetical protein
MPHEKNTNDQKALEKPENVFDTPQNHVENQVV